MKKPSVGTDFRSFVIAYIYIVAITNEQKSFRRATIGHEELPN